MQIMCLVLFMGILVLEFCKFYYICCFSFYFFKDRRSSGKYSRFQLDGTQTLSLTSTSIANISLSGSALAVFDGSSCNSNGYYAVFKEIFYNTNVFDNVTSLAVVGGNIELATGGTSTLKIMGVKNDGTTTVIDNSNFTFTATGSSATVSTAGVITASSNGTTTIEVVATSQASLTTACVVTVS